MVEIVSVKPKENPEPTRENLRLITARNLPPEQLIAAVRAAGFEVRSDGPRPYDDANHTYIGECQVDGIWYSASTLTPIIDDPAFQRSARTVVEVAAIHKAAAGD